MKKFAAAIVCFFVVASCYSQQLSQISFTNGANLSSIAFLGDQGVLIRCADDGRILEWGTEAKALRYEYYAPKLQPFPGKVVYYGAEADSVSRGKIKSIGTTTFTYYGAYEHAEKIGKIKTIGTLAIDYYMSYENRYLKGKIKTVGTMTLEYYSEFENEGFKGKLKSVGGTAIVYHSSFDDKAIRGKVKSIGGVSIAWYTSLDPGKMGGALKGGNYRQNIGGVTYILR